MITTQIPYPGLRPFERSESDIFFGREEQTDQLLRTLENKHFLAVVGPSGCGKSSLVRAGMIAGLETGYMAKAGARWRVATMRPNARPFRQLATALLDDSALGPERQDREDAGVFLETTLRRGPLGLIEVLRETPLPRDANLLLLVDQFEEVFRFSATTDHDEADAFVALLLSSTQREAPIYVVLTMRSDYIGDCAIFAGLPEALNQSQYLTPRLTREQRHSAIVGPARVFGGDVEPQLANRILNEMGPEPNLLPVFQHLLMRMWTYDLSGAADGKASRGAEGGSTPAPALRAAQAPRTASPGYIGSRACAVTVAEPQPTAAGRILTLRDYDAVGGFANALSNHANEVFDSLNENQRKTATLLFRRLCERGGQLRDVRRPTPLHEILELAHLNPDEVMPVADAFRCPEHSFLTPSFPEPLTTGTVLDITHESLIRQWDRLNKWVELERESARTYSFLAETASLWKEGRAALWGTPNLDEAIDWQQRENPTKEWAKRYGGDFELAEEFLEASRTKRDAELAEAKAQQERQLRRAHRLIAALTLTVVALVLGILTHRYLYVWDYKADYRNFVKVFGEPKGIGRLTSSQVRHRAESLRIIRKGRWGRVTEMQVVNSRGELTPFNNIGTYLRPASEDSSPMRECDWRFAYDSQGRIVNETAYNKAGKMVWGFAYSPTGDTNMTSRDAYYLGPDGYPKPEKGSAASFVHFEYSPDGYERRIHYRDRLANPMPGLDRAFGREMTFDIQGEIIELKSLDAHGNAMNDEFGNSILRVTYDESGNPVGEKAFDAAGLPIVVRDGWSQTINKFDENGNEIEIAYFDERAEPTVQKDGYHRQTISYDERGNIIEERFWEISGAPAVLSDGYQGIQLTYNDDGYVLQSTYVDSDRRPCPNKSGYATSRSAYDRQNREIERTFFDVSEKSVASTTGYSKVIFQYDIRGNPTQVAYFDNDGRATESVDGYARFTSEYDVHDNLVRTARYDSNGHPTTGKDRFFSRTFAYDDRSNETDEAYFGVDGKPAETGDGYVRWHSTYDQRGNDINDEFFDPSGNPVVSKKGYAAVKHEYDQLGNKTRTAYLGLHGEPVRNDEGVAGWISEYDSAGHETRRAYFDPDNRPAVLKGAGYASFEAVFDKGAHRTELTFFDLKHRLFVSSSGYAVQRMKYDSRGKVIEEAYFDANRKLTLVGGEKEYARVVHQYDQSGDQVQSTYFGKDNRPIKLKLGYHAVRRTFDDHHHPVEFRYYGLLGEPIETSQGYARRLLHVDKYGNKIDEAIFKMNGAPIAVGGCSQNVYKYDARQRRIEESCLGLDGHLAFRVEDGFAVRRFQYDERGNQTEVAYFGAQNEPIRWFQKAQHRVKSVYDSHDNKIEESYFDIDGGPMVGVHLKNSAEYEACTRWAGRYDAAGKLVHSQCTR